VIKSTYMYVATLIILALGLVPQFAMAQSVQTSPTASQEITQPTGTVLNIQSGSANNYIFTDPGFLQNDTSTSPGALFVGNITAGNENAGAGEYHLITPSFRCTQPGWDIGTNGTSLGGWSICDLMQSTFAVTQRGIAQQNGSDMNKFGQGDTAVNYSYLAAYGGIVAGSDEGVTETALHSNQVGYMKGPITSGGTTGSNLIQASISCNGFCQLSQGGYFPDGGMLLDYTKGGTAAVNLLDRQFNSALNNDYYDTSGTALPVSTAWGVMSNCTNNSTTPTQVYTSTTCQVTLGTSPVSPGPFVQGKDMFLSGPEQEEVAITNVSAVSAGVQSVTFNTRYAWNNWNTLAMQGGPGGQAFVVSTQKDTWPIAYAVVGATSPTTLFFSNCVIGVCNQGGGGAPNPITSTVLNMGRSLTRHGNVVTLTGGGNDNLIYGLGVGASVIVSGFTPSDLNGTFTVTSNSFDMYNVAVTWNQTGPDETTGVAGSVIPSPPQVTLYPMAFITGTNSGTIGAANLATNTVPFSNGDTVVGAPTSEYQQAGLQLYVGQTTPSDGGVHSRAFSIDDQGPSPAPFEMEVVNESASPAASLMNTIGPYNKYFNLGNRPAFNGCIICVFPSEAPASNVKKYTVFADGESALSYDPNTATMDWSGIPASGPIGNFTIGGGTHGDISAANGVFNDAVSAATVSAGTVNTGTVNANSVSVVTAGSAALNLTTTGDFQVAAVALNAPGVNPTSLGCWGIGNGAGLPGVCGLFDMTNTHFIWSSNTSDDLFGNTPVTDVALGTGAAWSLKHTGDATFSSSVTSPLYYGPSTAPAGSCSTNGAWVFSQDGHATFCASGSWVTKI
jgi:hypothetical protein